MKKHKQPKIIEKTKAVKCTHWRDCNVNNGGCCAINRYSRPSIAVCNRVCDENNRKSQGIGDTLAKAIEYFSRGKVKPKAGGGCGCNKRRKKLNKLLPYKKNKPKK